jgi:ubiquinone/menaquinone biosynthesis C-methylase UbiE
MKTILKLLIGTQHEWQSHIDNILYLLNKNLKTYKPNNLLDVGSGDGKRTLLMAQYFNIDPPNVYGVDYSDKYVAETAKIFNAEKIDLEVDQLPYDDEKFDLITCNQVLEHLKNYREVINDVIRVSRKGGYIVLGIPNLAHLINRIYLMLGVQPLCIHLNGPHVRGYTHRAFIDLLNSIKELELIDYTGSLMYPLPSTFSKYLAKYFVGLSGYTCYLLQKIREGL